MYSNDNGINWQTAGQPASTSGAFELTIEVSRQKPDTYTV